MVRPVIVNKDAGPTSHLQHNRTIRCTSKSQVEHVRARAAQSYMPVKENECGRSTGLVGTVGTVGRYNSSRVLSFQSLDNLFCPSDSWRFWFCCILFGWLLIAVKSVAELSGNTCIHSPCRANIDQSLACFLLLPATGKEARPRNAVLLGRGEVPRGQEHHSMTGRQRLLWLPKMVVNPP